MPVVPAGMSLRASLRPDEILLCVSELPPTVVSANTAATFTARAAPRFGSYAVAFGPPVSINEIVITAAATCSTDFEVLPASILTATEPAAVTLDEAGRAIARIHAGSAEVDLRSLPVDVRQFGAVGDWDGTTGHDDTEAFRSAVAFAEQATDFENFGSNSPATNHVAAIIVPDGTYRLTGAITVTRPLHVQGVKCGEFSSGSRLVQTNPNADIFTIIPQPAGMSFSMDRMTLRGSGTVGTGHLVNITRSATGAYCNSQRYTDCVFGQPSAQALKLVGDDILVHGCLFDVSAISGNAIQLGTATAGEIASNVRITGNNFFWITVRCLLIYHASNVLFAANQVTQPNTATTTMYVVDAWNSEPVLVRGLNITGNTMRGGRALMALNGGATTIAVAAFTNNVCYECGINVGETLDALTLAGNITGLTVTGNTISGAYDTRVLYTDAGVAGSVTQAVIVGNNFINTGNASRALTCSKSQGRIAANSFQTFPEASVSEKRATTGNAFAPGTINAGAAVTLTTVRSGALIGDRVSVQSAGATWPLSAGIYVDAWISAADTVSLRYTNPTAGNIAQASHDWIIEVTR